MTDKNEVIFEEDDGFEPDEEAIRLAQKEEQARSSKRNKSIRNLAIGGLFMAACSAPCAYHYPQARKLSDVQDDVTQLGEDMKTKVIPKIKSAESDPYAFAKLLKEERLKLENIIVKMKALQSDGLRLRFDVVRSALVQIKKARGKTTNDNLETIHAVNQALDFGKDVGTLAGFGAEISAIQMVLDIFDVQGLGGYEAIRTEMSLIDADLRKLRVVLIQMEDIDQVSVTNNLDVDLMYGIQGCRSKCSEFIETQKLVEDSVRAGTKLRMARLQGFIDVDNILEKYVSWPNGYESEDIMELQRAFVGYGLLAEDKISGKKDAATTNAYNIFKSVYGYIQKVYEKFQPEDSAIEDGRVKIFQKFMVYMGYLKDEDADGKYGAKMDYAIRKFMADYEALKTAK
jgi:hypothetical protein